MSTTVYFRIKASSAMLVECADGSYQVLAQVEDPETYRDNNLVEYIEGDDWALCPLNWKTDEGEPRAGYLGHDMSLSTLSDKVVKLEG